MKTSQGFTIVELLIVVVIIAILSTIIIISYRGITNRAYNARTLDAISQASTALRSFKATHNSFPNGTTDDTTINGFCLGNGFKDGICQKITYSEGRVVSSVGTTEESPGFDNEIKEFIASPIQATIHPPVLSRLSLSENCELTIESTGSVYQTAGYVRVDSQGRMIAVGGSSQDLLQDTFYITYYVMGENASCGPGVQSNPDFVWLQTKGWTACEISDGDKRT